MKITVVQDFLRSGGTERQSILLANAFAAAGHAATLLTFRPGGPLAETLAPEVARVSLQSFDTQLDWFAPGLRRRVADTRPMIALCLGRMANCYAGSLAALCPTVATMRTGKALPWLFRRSLARVHHIVANSRDACATLVREHAVPAGKISVIYNSLVFPADVPGAANAAVPAPLDDAPSVVSGSRTRLRAQHGATPATRVLLCVAMFRPEKNQRELIEIASGLPAELDWQLWLAGEGPARAACERLVAAKGLAARVKFLGFQRDPTPLYRAADLAVHASRSEALSNFLIEAQAHGLLGVAYAAQGIGECFKLGRTGWVIPPGDRSAFRGTLTRRMTEPAIAHVERAADARAYARTTFDPRRQVEAYLDLFARLAPSVR